MKKDDKNYMNLSPETVARINKVFERDEDYMEKVVIQVEIVLLEKDMNGIGDEE